MMQPIDIVAASWMGFSFEQDPDLVPPPNRPRLVPELVTIPFEEAALLIEGTETIQVLRGRSARGLLMRVFPHLDGTHTLDELVERTGCARSVLRDLIALLFSRGLLEEGVPEPADERFRDTMSFLGRFTDVSRNNRHRGEAFARLQQSVVHVARPRNTTPALEELVASLARSGVGAVSLVDVDRIGTSRCDLVVLVATGGDDDLVSAADAAGRADFPAFHIRVGAEAAHIGPMLLPRMTACYRCLARIHGIPPGKPSDDVASFWLGLAAHQIVLYLGSIAKPPIHLTLRTFATTSDGVESDMIQLPRSPGCAHCGIGGSSLPHDDPRYIAWMYHCSTTFITGSYKSKKEHQAHYRVANVKLASERSHAYVNAAKVRLPPPLELRANPWSPRPAARDRAAVDLSSLATVLGRANGFVLQNNVERRLVPSGGNLGSVDLFVIARQVAELSPGVYFYNAAGHHLERIAEVDDRALGDALRTSAPLPPCLVIGAGASAKTQQKYGNFSYRLIHLDAGVALGYIYAIAGALGTSVCELADFDGDALARSINLAPDQAYVPTFAIGLDAPPSPSLEPYTRPPVALSSESLGFRLMRSMLDVVSLPPPSPTCVHAPAAPVATKTEPVLATLDDVMFARRAVRSYAPTSLDAAVVNDLMTLAHRRGRGRVSAGTPDLPIEPWLVVRLGTSELPPGVYRSRDHKLERVRDGLTDAEMNDLVIQSSLARAAIAILFVADLDVAFEARGPRAYGELATTAGAMAAEVWLAATAFGHAACVAGGVAPLAFARLAGSDEYRACAFFGIFVGARAA